MSKLLETLATADDDANGCISRAELKSAIHEMRREKFDDMDDDAPKYNPALEMSFNNLINKSWEVLFDLMRNLSGTEYVTHMPYEMAEMIAKHYYKLL